MKIILDLYILIVIKISKAISVLNLSFILYNILCPMKIGLDIYYMYIQYIHI